MAKLGGTSVQEQLFLWGYHGGHVKDQHPQSTHPSGLRGSVGFSTEQTAKLQGAGQEKLTASGEVINWVKDNVAF